MQDLSCIPFFGIHDWYNNKIYVEIYGDSEAMNFYGIEMA